MPTTLRLFLLLTLGLPGLQPVGYAYGVSSALVSEAQYAATVSTENGAATDESPAQASSNFDSERTAWDRQADTREFSDFVAAERGVTGAGEGGLLPGGTGQAFAGHGIEAGFDGGFGSVTVPEGTSIMIPGQSGTMLPDALGRAIEAGNWDAISANPEWMKIMEGSASYLPGATVPNLILAPANDLFMLQNSIRVTTPTGLSDLLQPGMGPINWAACRQVF